MRHICVIPLACVATSSAAWHTPGASGTNAALPELLLGNIAESVELLLVVLLWLASCEHCSETSWRPHAVEASTTAVPPNRHPSGSCHVFRALN